jgi:hypothetical protein
MFERSRFVALDAEFVQYKNLKGPDKNRARSVAISDSQFRILESLKVSHKKEDVFINAATIRINGITYESLIDGESLKEVKAKVIEATQNKIIVTVGGSSDFRSLDLDETSFSTFDLQQFYYRTDPNNFLCSQAMSLRDMFFYHFEDDCQSEAHNAENDAINTMKVFINGYISEKYYSSFWSPEGRKIVDFDDSVNLNAQAKQGLIWCSKEKRFLGSHLKCDLLL